MNVKNDFLAWLAEKGTYKGTNFETYINRYIDFLNFDVFEILGDFSNIENVKKNILSKVEELKNNDKLLEFNNKSKSGAPSEILGKDNYFRFLDEFRSNINFKQTIALLQKNIESSVETKDLFELTKPSRSWVWIKDTKGLIGTSICHYEISYNKQEMKYFVDIHFEGKKAEQIQFEPLLKELPLDLIKIKWRIIPSIRHIKSFSASSYNLVEKLKSQLFYIETTIGNQLREIIKSPSSNNNKQTNMNLKQPLNQILFGPPGTGKTYNTINKALEIVDPTFYDLHKEDRIALKQRFNELQYNTETEKGQIAFITFHQSMTYEDFIEGIKPIMNDDKSENQEKKLEYEISAGLFKQISKTAEFKESNFYERIEWLKKECSEADSRTPIEINTGRSIFTISYRGGKTFKVKPNNSTKKESDYSASIENIKKLFDNKTDNGMYNPTYVKGILEFLEKNGLQKESIENKSYVLIIDEINRGNVSQIFGELITLIEEDKRLGNDEVLEILLPYSKEKFGVPSNLYILGTMNTADRSVEALDTALRRRFSFEEMPPKYDLEELKFEISGFNASDILKVINNRIEKLIDKDHAIGHSYFMLKDSKNSEEKICNSFYLNIIPLLQEYFFGDYGKIGLVLGKGFVCKKEWGKDIDKFANFDYESSSDFEERDVYEIIDYRKEDLDYSIKQIKLNFNLAIKLLMNEKIENE